MTIEERMEAARVAGDRKEFLRLKEEAEKARYSAIQERHKAQVAKAKEEFPVGEYIDGVGRIEAITDGCGTQSGWIAVKIAGQERTVTPAEIRAKIAARTNRQRVNAEYRGIKYTATAHGAVYIPGEYNDAIDNLLTYMDMGNIRSL